MEDWLELDEVQELQDYKEKAIAELIEDLDEAEITAQNQEFITRVLGKEFQYLHLEEFAYLMDRLTEQFEIMQKEIDSLKELKNHRHRTFLGYTEKPAW